MSVEFKLYHDDDYRTVIELWQNAGIKISLSDQKEELAKLAFKQDNKFLLLVKESVIIGSIICAHDGRRGYIHHLAILPRYQRLGYGKILMDEAKKHYTKLKTVKVHIFIEKINDEVVDFYEKLNWQIRDDIILMTQTLRLE